MHILQKITAAVATLLLPVMLFSFGSLVSVYQVLGSPDTIKTAIDKSGLYDSVVPSLLKQVQKGAEDQQPGSSKQQIPLNDPAVQGIINKAVSSDYIKQQTNGVLDSAFAVIQGKDSKLNFEINLQDVKTRLADGLGAYTEQHLASLPACTSLADFDPNTFDPLTAECAPAGIDKAAVAAKVRSQILTNDEFLKDPVISASDIQGTSGKSVDKQLQMAGQAYGLVKTGIWVTGILALAFAVAIILLNASKRAGARRVGIIAISTGASVAALALLVSFVLKFAADTLAKNAADATIQARLVDAISYATNDLRNWWAGYGLALLITGIIMIITLRLTKPAVLPNEPTTATTTTETTTEKESEPPKNAPPTVLS